MRNTVGQCLRTAFLLLSVSMVAKCLAADPEAEKLRPNLISTWIVEVRGEARTRTLNIANAEKKQDGVWVLDATYGWSDTRQTAVKAKLTTKADRFKLEITTQADSVIVAEGSDLQKLEGTFTARSGMIKLVTLERIAADALAKRVAANVPTITQPGPDVPAACAPLIGLWTGTWPNFGQTWLWVVEIDARCVARYAHRTSPKIYDLSVFKKAEIKDGILSAPDDRGDMDSFELHGDELWARHTGSAANGTVFRKVQVERK